MSMLLDALKKSEEQRQLGSTPGIHQAADHNPDGHGDRALPWLPVLLSAVAVSLMAWFGWNQLRAPEGVAFESQPRGIEPPAERARLPGITQPATEPGPQPRTMVEQYSPANSGEAGNAPVNQQQDELRKDVNRSFKQFAAKTPETKAQPGKSAAVDSSAPAKSATPYQQPDRSTSPPSDSARPGPAASEPWEAGPMSYWALPQGVRDSLPEFRITVLVFADNPADRFLLINGTRLKEKDELQSGVVLDEIRREGAVFRARNYRFLVRGG